MKKKLKNFLLKFPFQKEIFRFDKSCKKLKLIKDLIYSINSIKENEILYCKRKSCI